MRVCRACNRYPHRDYSYCVAHLPYLRTLDDLFEAGASRDDIEGWLKVMQQRGFQEALRLLNNKVPLEWALAHSESQSKVSS